MTPPPPLLLLLLISFPTRIFLLEYSFSLSLSSLSFRNKKVAECFERELVTVYEDHPVYRIRVSSTGRLTHTIPRKPVRIICLHDTLRETPPCAGIRPVYVEAGEITSVLLIAAGILYLLPGAATHVSFLDRVNRWVSVEI